MRVVCVEMLWELGWEMGKKERMVACGMGHDLRFMTELWGVGAGVRCKKGG